MLPRRSKQDWRRAAAGGGRHHGFARQAHHPGRRRPHRRHRYRTAGFRRAPVCCGSASVRSCRARRTRRKPTRRSSIISPRRWAPPTTNSSSRRTGPAWRSPWARASSTSPGWDHGATSSPTMRPAAKRWRRSSTTTSRSTTPSSSASRASRSLRSHRTRRKCRCPSPTSGSTSGWLIPTFTAKTVWHIDPHTFWQYREGATHAANEIAVASGQVDLATDFDRNRNAMIASGKLKPDATQIVWTSDPLPNDAIVVRPDAPAGFADKVRGRADRDHARAGQGPPAQPATTGFVAADHESYRAIEQAGPRRRQDQASRVIRLGP